MTVDTIETLFADQQETDRLIGRVLAGESILRETIYTMIHEVAPALSSFNSMSHHYLEYIYIFIYRCCIGNSYVWLREESRTMRDGRWSLAQ